ncbi:protein melted isoform X3 [Anastrepha ludens]|uniref:protein melted isoform X3 n=1 Tax=Anastrepha ludens TaxID=28586 RepID=UPI0023B0722F|nr:protein melted isoform X3 [Anastrepha ludens]
MHELFTKVLSKRDLSRAGDLFSVPDSDIVNDISEVLSDISPIISHLDYLKNNNDQSVVEICVTRVLSCIRETKTAERYCAALVDLLRTCLLWNLQPAGSGKEDPPHAKIAADIISSIFLNYDKKEVMKISLPVAVQFLPKGNRELSRNLASYLSLAAIDYAYLLSPHVSSIMDSIMSGNFGLLRVLSQIYEVSPDEVSPHAPLLVALLPQCDSQEKLAVLQLYLLIAQKTPAVLESCVPRLCELLFDNETATIAMQTLLKISEQRPLLIVEHSEKIKAASKANPNTISLAAQILASAGRTNKVHAQNALDFVLEHLPHADRTSQTNLLQEATKLCSSFPVLFTDKVLACVRQKNALSQQKLSSSDINMDVSNKTSGGVTIVNLNSPTDPPPPTPTAAAAVVATVLNTVAGNSSNNASNASATSIPITGDPASSTTTVSLATTTATTGRLPKSKNKSRSSPSSPKDISRKALLSGNLKISTAQTTAGNTNTTVIHQSNNAAAVAGGPPVPPTPPHAGYTRRVKLGDSRSTGRLHPTGNTHRSMTRLNVAGGSVGGLHKSMTRLSSSQHINQNGGSCSNNANNSQSSGNVVVQTSTGASTTTVGAGAPPKIPTSPSSPGYVTPVPPLSNNVIITGHNKWGIPSTQVTSGGVTVTTSPTKVRPHSQGPTTLLNSSTALLKYSTDALNQSIGSISIPQNPVSVHHASPALPQQNNGNQKSVMKLPVNGNSTHEVIVSGPTTNMTPRRNNNNTSRTLLNANNSCILDQRMSTFEPYQIMRDPVQQFCEKHFGSIKSYMDEVSQSLPPPTRCSIEGS